MVVIGGGDTGTDCVATALLPRLPQPGPVRDHASAAGASRPDNPWPQWPRIYKMDYGQAEAAAVFGDDPRAYSVQTTELLGDEAGRVRGLRTVDVAWRANGDGRSSPQPMPGTTREWPAQMVILALGFLGPEEELLSGLGVTRDGRSNVATLGGRFQTGRPASSPPVTRRGQSLVVWAIHEGRAAAREVDHWLMGETNLP